MTLGNLISVTTTRLVNSGHLRLYQVAGWIYCHEIKWLRTKIKCFGRKYWNLSIQVPDEKNVKCKTPIFLTNFQLNIDACLARVTVTSTARLRLDSARSEMFFRLWKLSWIKMSISRQSPLIPTFVTVPNLMIRSPCLMPALSAGLPATTTMTRAKGAPAASFQGECYSRHFQQNT